jgi:transketolase
MTTLLLAQREVWIDTMVELGANYPDMVLLDGDLASASFCQKFENAYPQRFFQMGIAEQNMAGVAAGMATLGFIPWTNSFAVFEAKRMLDQIRVVIAQPNLNVKMAAHYSGILAGKTGKTHIAVQDIAIMRAMPHMTVIVPCDGIELKKAMYAVMEFKGPTYLRMTRSPEPVIFGEDYRFEIGKAKVVREGRDITIIGTGVQTLRAVEAAQQLASQGIEAHVLHVPTLKPLDAKAIVAAADKTGLVLTTEEHSVIGGLGAAVAEVLGQERPTLMRIHGLQDTYAESGPNEAMLEKYRLTPKHVVIEAQELLARARKRR